MPPKVSILDFGDLGLEATLELAQLADQLGFSRYWLAQHIGARFTPNPVIVSSVIAGTTETIRVGTAGVLLRYFAPREVVADFLTLDNVFPGRIDLGLASGFADASVRELEDGRDGTHADGYFETKVNQVSSYLSTMDGLGESNDRPSFWLLGSSGARARFAGEHGFCYSLSLFHNSRSKPAPDVLDAYRQSFVPSKWLGRPTSSLLIAAVCAEHEAAAGALALRADRSYPFYTLSERSIGDVLGALASEYGVDELVIRDVSPDLATRSRAFRIMASALRLPPLSARVPKEP